MPGKQASDVIGDDGRVRILHPACSTCVFRRGNLMHLAPGRLEDLVRRNVEANALLTCHETLPGNERGYDPAVCGCFWALHRHKTLTGRLAERLIGITRIHPPERTRPCLAPTK